MGTVHLTNGHHGLYVREDKVDLSRRIVLDAELLARPILNGNHELSGPTVHVIRAALQGLMDLRGFDAAVSYHAAKKGGISHIALPHRVWGEITLERPENVIVGFSHDTRYEHRPFYVLFEWLEDAYPATRLSDEEYEHFCLGWSYPERWREFFEARILRRAQEIQSRAENLIREGQDILKHLRDVEDALT